MSFGLKGKTVLDLKQAKRDTKKKKMLEQKLIESNKKRTD